MSTLLGDARIRVRADTNGFESEAKSGVMSGMKKIGALAAAALGGAIALGLKGAISEASNLEQSMGAIDAVFKSSGKTVKAWAAQAAQASGLSKNEFGELATTLGAMLKNKGIQDFTGQTKTLIDLGGDLAAQFGGDTKTAVEAISSLMRGEADPIEQYGVSINETAINAKLAAQGLTGLTGAALEQAKAQARLSILMDQTKDAQGAFARESGTAANAQQKLNAAWSNTKGALGQAFLPLVSSLAERLTGFLPTIESIGAKMPAMFTAAKNALTPLWEGLKATAGFLWDNKETVMVLVGAWAAYSAATKTAALAQTAMNLAMKANPIGLVVTALAALAAAAVYAWNNSETFREIVTGAWTAVQEGAAWMWNKVLKPTFDALVVGWNVVADGVAWAWSNVLKPTWDVLAAVLTTLWNSVLSPIFGLIGSVFLATLQAMGWAWDNVLAPVLSAVWTTVSFLWQNVLSPIFSAIGSAWSDLMTGMKWVWDNVLDPVFKAFGGAVDWVRGIFDTAVEGIGAAWDKIKSFIAAPVKWVVDTVWNNGLVAAWNWINNLWDDSPEADIKGVDTKSWSFASGGILPGYTPGRDVHRFYSPTGGILDLSGGEAIMRPEVSRVLGPGGVEALNAAARSGGSSAVAEVLAGMAPRQAFADGGLIKIPQALKWAVPNWLEGKIEDILNNPFMKIVGGLVGTIGKKFWDALDFNVDMTTVSNPEDLNANARVLGLDNPTVVQGSLGNSWAGIWTAVKAAIPQARQNSTYRDTPDRHGMGKAIDFGFGDKPGGAGSIGLASINRFLYDNYKSELYELIYDGLYDDRPDLKKGAPLTYNAATRAQHHNHVHAAVYDSGGILKPGLTMAYNGTGRNEYIRTADQERALGGSLVDHLEIRLGDSASARDVADEVLFALRRVKRGGLLV